MIKEKNRNDLFYWNCERNRKERALIIYSMVDLLCCDPVVLHEQIELILLQQLLKLKVSNKLNNLQISVGSILMKTIGIFFNLKI